MFGTWGRGGGGALLEIQNTPTLLSQKCFPSLPLTQLCWYPSQGPSQLSRDGPSTFSVPTASFQTVTPPA